jgi:hypothetical protein
VARSVREAARAVRELVKDIQLEVDPVSGVMSAAALVVAILAFKASKRSADVSVKLAEERGRFKKVTVTTAPPDPTLYKGRAVGWESAHPKRDMSTGALEVTAYSGEHGLTVSEAQLVILYTVGVLQPRVYILSIPFGTEESSTLNAEGPQLPSKIGPYDQVRWRLPKLVIVTGTQRTFSSGDFPGSALLDPWRTLTLTAVVRSTSWQPPAAGRLSFGYRWVARRARSRLARFRQFKGSTTSSGQDRL